MMTTAACLLKVLPRMTVYLLIAVAGSGLQLPIHVLGTQGRAAWLGAAPGAKKPTVRA